MTVMNRRKWLSRSVFGALAGVAAWVVPASATRDACRVLRINRYHPAAREYGATFEADRSLLDDEQAFLAKCHELRRSLIDLMDAHVREHGPINLVRVPPMLVGFVSVRARVGSVSEDEIVALKAGKRYTATARLG